MTAAIVANRPAPRREDFRAGGELGAPAPACARKPPAVARCRRHHLSFFRHVSFRYSLAPHIRPSAPRAANRCAPRVS
ncbi:2',3'-cyclic-nucleotide 2'-phosphodiesterase [Burkholderia sp. AU4i]|nr:2',3'-cyclic-nucleotide 2'-phosphodiesterase [Burkholderia sp. AU4i]